MIQEVLPTLVTTLNIGLTCFITKEMNTEIMLQIFLLCGGHQKIKANVKSEFPETSNMVHEAQIRLQIYECLC